MIKAWSVALLFLALGAGCAGGDDTCVGAECSACSVTLTVSPGEPDTDDLVQVSADVVNAGSAGLVEFDWSLRYDELAFAFAVDGADDDLIVFDPELPGIYSVVASATVGGLLCEGAERDINVTEPGADEHAYRLRIVPAGVEAPAQDVDLSLPSGGDYALGTLTVDDGVLAGGTVIGPGSTPLPSYLRATLTGDDTPLYTEAFADDDGDYDVRLLSRAYDLLVVPEAPTIAPLRLDGVTPEDVDGGIALDAGALVTGTVVDGAGDPVAGARVALSVAGVPSTLATTSAGGGFSLRVRPGGPVGVTVTPAPGSGLAQLVLAPAAGTTIAGGDTVAVAYSAAVDAVTVAPSVRLVDGTTPAPGARVTWRARDIAAAGTISIEGDDRVAIGRHTHATVAGGGGALAPVDVPEATYDVIVEPPVGAPAGQGVRLATVNLGGGAPPATLSLAASGRVIGVLVDVDGAPVAGAHLRAEPRGPLSLATTAGSATESSSDGSFELAVAGGGSYQVVIDGAVAGQARVRREVVAPAAGATQDLGLVDLPAPLRVEGGLARIGELPLARAHVELVCLDCLAEGPLEVVAEALTDLSGSFVLIVPDLSGP